APDVAGLRVVRMGRGDARRPEDRDRRWRDLGHSLHPHPELVPDEGEAALDVQVALGKDLPLLHGARVYSREWTRRMERPRVHSATWSGASSGWRTNTA